MPTKLPNVTQLMLQYIHTDYHDAHIPVFQIRKGTPEEKARFDLQRVYLKKLRHKSNAKLRSVSNILRSLHSQLYLKSIEAPLFTDQKPIENKTTPFGLHQGTKSKLNFVFFVLFMYLFNICNLFLFFQRC